ncbi:4'-phosphopantetheinyl transferase family protein [Cyclobacterium jeungdonense]|uniref:4'-phosphopantetheinyl transferase superfamily protein n=1 Tax=Cyclobacterium jeungdonense TaxID=708087 RepID=A0ABT8C7S9_9BACT|nr:4'-phosphopantetheinyl transferase superfamily protein [Cyclobacterium jeungdonense]MDN3687673.1 4'-phosphopantetheinyl transferase superfamily protein [Cyclobacterium jeungdonense]
MPKIRVFCEEISPPDWKEIEPSQTGSFLDIWRIPLSSPDHIIEHLKGLMTDEEIQQANRYLKKEDRIRHILGKGFLRKLIQLYLNEPQKSIQFGKNRFNKPFLIERDHFHFNISHSGEWVVIVLADCEVGIDLEPLDSRFEYKDLLAGIFSSSEIEFIENSPIPVRSFYKIWTRKEALLKGIGQGITDQLSEYCLLDGLQGFNFSGKTTYEQWHIRSFIMNSNYYVSLALPSKNHQLRFLNWDSLPFG